MFKFVVLLVLLFAVVDVFGQSYDYADSEPINNENAKGVSQKSSGFPCTRGWTYFPRDGICLFATPVFPWNAAKQYCENLGSHLMSVHGINSFENAKVMLGDGKDIWIGLNKNNNEKTWKNANNATVNYLSFAFDNSCKCAHINGLSLYRDQTCETQFPGICQVYAFA